MASFLRQRIGPPAGGGRRHLLRIARSIDPAAGRRQAAISRGVGGCPGRKQGQGGSILPAPAFISVSLAFAARRMPDSQKGMEGFGEETLFPPRSFVPS